MSKKKVNVDSIEIASEYLTFQVQSSLSSGTPDEMNALIHFDIKIYGGTCEDYYDPEKEEYPPAYYKYLDLKVAEKKDDEILIGRGCAYLGNFSQYDVEPEYALDIEEITFEYKWLYDEGYFQEDILYYSDDEFNSNILIMDRIEILPPFRGQHLGLLSLVHLSRQLKLSASLVALKAYPMQQKKNDQPHNVHWGEDWARAMNYPKFKSDDDWAKDKQKLAKYYEKAGFHSVRDGYFMVTGYPELDKKTAGAIKRKQSTQSRY